jgi:hypothetical protein
MELKRRLFSPIVLTITGASMTIISVILSGFIISSNQSSLDEIRKTRENYEKEFLRRFHNYELSESKIDQSVILTAIIDSIKPEANVRKIYIERTLVALNQAYYYRSLSAHIDPNKGEYFERKKEFDQRLRRGDLSTIRDIMNLINELHSNFDADGKRLAHEHSGLISKESNISKRISLFSRLSITFQILGLIMVLAKDLAPKKQP